MRAFETVLWRGVMACALACAWIGEAAAFGGLVTPDGNGTITATRLMTVRGADDLTLNIQIRYQGTPASAVWLIPLPNFTEPADDGVRSGIVGQDALDALDEATRPVMLGECDGMPTGATQPILQTEQYGPANQMALPTRFFTVTDITMGALDTYLDGLGITLDMAMADGLSRVIDENYMLAAVRIDTAALGVNRIDPIVSLRYPAAPNDQVKLGLRLLAPTVGAGPADMVLWLFEGNRLRANFATEELDYGGIRFISPSETDYVPAFDMQVGARQSQMFVIENARPVDGATFADPDLAAAAGAGFLTRLRARIVPAALRNNMAFVSFREAGVGEVGREHAVEGYMCGGEPDPDMGPGADAGLDMDPGPETDMDPGPGADADPLRADIGDDEGGGGGGSSGCVAGPGSPSGTSWPAMLILSLCLCLPGLRRRG